MHDELSLSATVLGIVAQGQSSCICFDRCSQSNVCIEQLLKDKVVRDARALPRFAYVRQGYTGVGVMVYV